MEREGEVDVSDEGKGCSHNGRPHPEQGVSRVAANQVIKQEQTLFATGFFTLMYFFLGRNMIEKNYSSVSSPNP